MKQKPLKLEKKLFSLQRKHGCRNKEGELVNYKIGKIIQKDLAHTEETTAQQPLSLAQRIENVGAKAQVTTEKFKKS